MSEQRFDLGGKHQTVGDLCVEERLDTEAVTGQKQLATRLIPDRERKHAAQARQDRVFPFAVTAEQHFGVAPAVERVSIRHQLGTERFKVVDLAVERHIHA